MLHILGFFVWRIYGTEINSIPFCFSTLQHLPFQHSATRLSISNHLLSFDHADFEMFIPKEGYTNWQCINHPKLHCHWLGEDKNWFLQWQKQLKSPIKSSHFFFHTENLGLLELKFLSVASARCVWSPIHFYIWLVFVHVSNICFIALKCRNMYNRVDMKLEWSILIHGRWLYSTFAFSHCGFSSWSICFSKIQFFRSHKINDWNEMVKMKLESYKIRDLHTLSVSTNNAQYMDIRSTVVIPKFQRLEMDLQYYFTYIYWIRFPTM
jgi:hypothetical protein